MSQQEFDTYLALLCRLLRIAPQQREQVAEEFRAHMEDRLDELLAKGLDREAAVKLALEEFGDAAGLAAQIASISQGRRKRWIMRIGTVSVAGLAAAGLLAAALWPEGAQVKAPQVVAQTGDKPGVPEVKPAKDEQKKSIEEKLEQRIDVEYPEVSLKEVLEDLKDRAGVQMYVNRKGLPAEAEVLDAPITINLKQVRLDMVLDLVLEQAGEGRLAYVERDGILIVSSLEALSGASEVKVYNCRDLLAMASPVPQPHGMMGGFGGMMGGSGMMPGGQSGGFGAPSAPAENQEQQLGSPHDEESPQPQPPGNRRSKLKAPRLQDADPAEGAEPEIPKGIAPQFGGGVGAPPAAGGGGEMGGMMGGGGAGFGGGPPRTDEEVRAERLMHLITTAVKPDSWQDMGGFGTISEYKGLIVINHNARTHKEVENVLKMLRGAAGLPEGGPAGGMMGPMMPGGGGRPMPPRW
jgi:hypothetical protein